MSSYNQTAGSISQKQPLSLRRLAFAGGAAVAAAVAANLVFRAMLVPLWGLSLSFPPFQPGAIAFFTALFTFFGVLAYALVYRLSKNPPRTYLVVALAALAVSILPNLAMMANPAAAPFPGQAEDFGILIAFHVVAAAAFLFTLLRLGLPRSGSSR
jgi:hypothetical protein